MGRRAQTLTPTWSWRNEKDVTIASPNIPPNPDITTREPFGVTTTGQYTLRIAQSPDML